MTNDEARMTKQMQEAPDVHPGLFLRAHPPGIYFVIRHLSIRH